MSERPEVHRATPLAGRPDIHDPPTERLGVHRDPPLAGRPEVHRDPPLAGRPDMHGDPPLTGRLERWMATLLNDPGTCTELVERHGSPVNVIDPRPLIDTAARLVGVGTELGLDIRLFLARKANKTLGVVDAMVEAGHGVDVASAAELAQVLDRGVPGERIILTSAIKPDTLLDLAVRAGVVVSADTPEEATRIGRIASALDAKARVAPRIAPEASHGLAPTRFGASVGSWLTTLPLPGVEVVGVHFHLNGYRAADRVAATVDALRLIDALRERGQHPQFVDIGGGMPMSYLDDADQWATFWKRHRAAEPGLEEITWKGRQLGSVYPFHQSPVQADWLREVLRASVPGEASLASALARRGLRLHLEPGRALLDGCGLTLARVGFVKRRSDGVGLVGLEMNRTQCRSTSDDFLVDPVLVRRSAPGPAFDGFLVGAYCIEDELILLRRMHCPRGVQAGDVVALVNTGGYLMHILESASHQIPLARNVLRTPDGFVLDAIDLL